MSKKYLTLLLCCLAGVARAQLTDTLQKDTTRNRIVAALYGARQPERDSVLKIRNLVSAYAFKNLIKADFSALTGLDNTATVGRYASLAVDKDASTFTFTPVTIARQDLTKGPFRFIHSFDFSGTVNNQGNIDLTAWRTVALSYSLTYLFNVKYKFKPTDKPEERDYTRITAF